MQLLEERILKDGIVKPGNVLKVDSFLNHQMDIAFINELGKEFQRRFADAPITKILTIEASGIGTLNSQSGRTRRRVSRLSSCSDWVKVKSRVR